MITRILILAFLSLGISNAFASDYNYIDDSEEEDYPLNYYNKCSDIPDPFERFNRSMFRLNNALDIIILKPVSRGYKRLFNESARDHVANAAENVTVPLTTVNSALQLKGDNVINSFWQFVINSTLGIAGLENVAKKQNLYVKPQTFGSTLARYGVGPGAYVVLPVFGSTNMRDMFDPIMANRNLNPINRRINKNTRYGILAISTISNRTKVLPFTDHIEKTSTDPYITFRSAVHQNREKAVDYPTYYRCK